MITARLKQANLVTKADIADFIKKTSFDDKLKIKIKKLLQMKQNMWRLKKKLIVLTNKAAQISEKGYDFLLG